MAKYRILECKNIVRTWYEVDRKTWFGWSKEEHILYNFLPLPTYSYPKEFNTYEQAKAYIEKKKPVGVIKKLPVSKITYDTIEF